MEAARAFPSELLKELEDQVPQADPEHLVVVTDDMGRVFLNLDEGLGFLPVYALEECLAHSRQSITSH